MSDNVSLTYAWDFGDGTTSTDVNPTHVYATAGTYQVTLTVFREEGCEDSQTRPVIIDELPVTEVCGYVLEDGTDRGIAGSGVSFEVRIDGRWQGSGAVIVDADGYYSFRYEGVIEAIRLTEQNVEGYTSTRVAPVAGGLAVDLDTMIHENVTPSRHCAYNFYDIPWVGTQGCGCPEYTVFHSNRDNNWELYRLTPGSDSAPINLTNHDATDMAPSIALNSNVAFQSDRNGNWDIYMVDAMGQNSIRLTDNLSDDTDPVWAEVCQEPRLAFQSNRDGHYEIYVMDMVPGNERRVTTTLNGDATDPFWAPDAETWSTRATAMATGISTRSMW